MNIIDKNKLETYVENTNKNLADESRNNNHFENLEEESHNIYNDDNYLTFARTDENKKEPIYVMTIELEKGKSDIIQIYPESSADELAFEFAKKYNLNLKAMKFLSEEINKLLEKITIQSKIINHFTFQMDASKKKMKKNQSKIGAIIIYRLLEIKITISTIIYILQVFIFE